MESCTPGRMRHEQEELRQFEIEHQGDDGDVEVDQQQQKEVIFTTEAEHKQNKFSSISFLTTFMKRLGCFLILKILLQNFTFPLADIAHISQCNL